MIAANLRLETSTELIDDLRAAVAQFLQVNSNLV